MPPGLMSRRKRRLMGWGMGTGEWGLGIGDWRMGQQESASAGRGRGQLIISIAPPESL